MRKLLHRDYFDYEDVMSELLTIAYRRADKIDFSLGYISCRNLLSTLITNCCKNILIRKNAQKRIPSNLINSIKLKNDEEEDILEDIVIINENKINKDKPMDDRIIILLEHAKREEDPLIHDILSMWLDGWLIQEIARKLNIASYLPYRIIKGFTNKLKNHKII
jgi:hypothetical protein